MARLNTSGRSLLFLLAIGLALCLAPLARAGSDIWSGSANGAWANANNWLGLSVPGTLETATFNSASANTVIDFGVGVTNSSIIIDPGAAAYTFGFGGAGAQTLTLDSGGSIMLNAGVGSGQLLNATLNLSEADAASAAVTNNSAFPLTLAGGVVANVLSGNGSLTVSGTGDTIITGAITKPGAGNNALLKTGAGTLTISSNGVWSGSGAIAGVPSSFGVPVAVREGKLLLNNSQTNVLAGELVIGGVVANGGVGQNATVQVDSGLVDVNGWLSVGRGNGTGTVSSVLILNSNARVEYDNFSAGYNGGDVNNFVKGAVTLNGASTVSGANTTHIAESGGSDFTFNINGSSSWTSTGGADMANSSNAVAVLNINDSAAFTLGGALSMAYNGSNSTATVFVSTNATLTIGTGTTVVGRQNNKGTMIVKGKASVGGTFEIGRATASADSCKGTVIVDGGSLSVEGDLNASAGGNSVNGTTNTLTITNNGTVNVATTTKRWLIVGQYDTPYSILNVNGGKLNLNAETDIRVGSAGGTGTNVINLTSGGAITFYSDNGTNLGSAGVFDFEYAGGANSYTTFNLDGGTITVPGIVSTVTTGTRIFNLNGGTLKAATNSANWVNLGTGNAFANVRNGGVILDSSTNNVTLSQVLAHSNVAGDAATDGGLIKTGAGTLTLAATNTYTGNTVVKQGILALSNSIPVGTSASIIVSNGATLDVAGVTGGFTLVSSQPLFGGGFVNGLLTTISGSKVYAGLDAGGSYATNTFNNDLTMASGAAFYLDLGNGAKDIINVAGTLALNSTVFHLKAPSTGTALDTANYVLATATVLTGSPIIQWDVAPSNAGHYYLEVTGTQVVMHYTPNNVPVVVVTVNPVTSERNQSVSISASVTADAPVTSVSADLSPIGLGTVSLVLSNNNVFTNTVVVSGSATTGIKSLAVSATDSTPLTGQGVGALTILGSTEVWNGLAADNLWGSGANWMGLIAPHLTGDSLVFSNSLKTTSVIEQSYSVVGLTFDPSATNLTLTATGASTLTVSSNGIVNNSTNAQVLNLPIVVNTVQAINANAGNIAIVGVVSGAGGLAKTGAGTLTLTNANTYTGNTTLSLGKLNLNNAAAIGTAGTLTVNGGILDNASGASITVVSNKPQQWAGDFTFAGTTNLSFGSGAVTLAGSGTSRQVTVSSNQLTVGAVTGSTNGLTKAGSGTLTLGGATLGGGTLNVAGGTVEMSQDISAGGLTGTGTLQTSGTGVNKWFYFNSTNNSTFSGTLRNYPGTTGRGMGLNKSGSGALTLNGTVTINDTITVGGGTLNLIGAGVAITNINHSNAVFNVANSTSSRAAMTLQNGAKLLVNWDPGNTYTGSAFIGDGTTSSGSLRIITNGTFYVKQELHIAHGTTSYGAFAQSGGNTTIGGFLCLAYGGTGSSGIFDLSGGSVSVTNAPVTIGATASGIGVLNLSGTAAFTNSTAGDNGVWLGENGTGILNISDNALLVFNNANNGLQLGKTTNGAIGQANLNGGTVVTKSIYGGATTVTKGRLLNFNGGTVRASGNTTNLIGNLDQAMVFGGGVTLDDGGFSVTNNQKFESPQYSGVASIQVVSGGSNYIDAPIVVFTNADGIGASAIAQIDYTAGTVTNIVVTCPGDAYFNIPTVVLRGGGGSGATVVASLNAGNNRYGSVTKTGTGTLFMNSDMSYFSGSTRVLQGALSLNSSFQGMIWNLIVTNSQLNFTATNGATMLRSGLTFAGSSVLNLNYGSLINGNLPAAFSFTAYGASLTNTGTVTINISASGVQVGTFKLFDTGVSTPTNGFVLGSLPPGVRGYLQNSGSSLDLVVTLAGQTLRWYGGDPTTSAVQTNWDIGVSRDWTDNIVSTNGARYLQYNMAGTMIGDNVLFDDNIFSPDSGNVNLTTTVSPATLAINNATYDYYFSGSGSIAGDATLVKNGAASLFLNTSNSYTGGTVIGGGTVVITNNTAFGNVTNAVALNGSTLLFGANGASARAFSLSGATTIGVTNNATLGLSGSVSGLGSLTKTGNGTLSLTAVTNNYTGLTTVKAGTLTVSGLIGTNTANLEIAPGVTDVATVQILPGADYEMDRGIVGGNSANTVGAGVGTLIQSGGIINSREWFTIGSGGGTAGSGGIGIYNMSGGVLNVQDQPMEVGNFINATGTVNMTGSAVINIWNSKNIQIGSNPNAGAGTFNQNGGTVSFYSDKGTNLGGTGILGIGYNGTLSNTFAYNLNGGLLRAAQIQGNTANAATRVFNFNGGVLQAAKTNTTFMFGLTSANVQSGGAIIDTTSNSVTITQALLNAGGGLTKLGSGALALTGANTFNGPITVTAGAVNLTPAHLGGNAVTVADNAIVGTTDGGTVALSSVMVSNSAVQFILNSSNTPVSPLMNVVGTLTVNGAAQIRVVGKVKTGSYPVLSFGSITGSGAFSPMVGGSQGIVGTLSTNGNVLWVNITDVGGIVWSGTNPDPAFTNIWNLNTITNWLVGGSTPTAYQETTPPGDSVIFNDLGSGLVLLSNTASPNSLTFSNNAVSYTIQGSGSLAGDFVITKNGTNAATVSISNNTRTGNTFVNDGTLNISGSLMTSDQVVISTNAGAKLNIISAATVGALTGGATTNGTLAFGGTLTLGGNNLPTVFNGNIDGGSQALTKNGTNLVTFGGNVTNTGTVTWNSGTLNVQSNWIAGAVNYNSGGGNANISGYWRTAAFNKYDTNTLNITGTLTNTATSQYRYGTVTVATNAILGVLGQAQFAWSAGNTNTVNVYGTLYSSDWLCVGGSTSLGVMNIYPGALVRCTNGTVAANNGTSQVGIVNLYGGAYTNFGTQNIGENGTAVGTFNQYGGASGFGTLNLGNNAGCTGILNVYGGQLIQRDNTVQVGFAGSLTAPGGTGVINITNGFVDLYTLLVQHSMGDGTLNVLGGTLRVRNQLSLGSGTTAQENGTTRMTIGSGGTLVVKTFWGGHGGGAGPSVKNCYMTNSGSIIITNGGYWDFDRWDGIHGEMQQNAGDIKFLGNSQLQFTSTGGSSIGLFNHNGGNVTFYSDSAGLIPGGTGYINMDAGTGGVNTNTYNLNGGILTVPSIKQSSTAAGNYCTFNFNGGTLKAAASSTTFLQGLNAVFVNSEAKIDTTNNNITILQPLLDGGTGAGLTKTGNGTLNLNGTNTYTGLTTVSAGSLGGNGTIAGSVMVNAGAGIAPGASGIGKLTINGNLTLNTGTTNVFELNGTNSSNDSVVLGANVTYGGVLKIAPTSKLTAGQKFQLFSGPGATNSGNFASIVCDANPGAVFTFADGWLTVVSYINTNPPQMQMSVSGSTMTLAWPTNAGWILQWQTNSLSTGLSTNWVNVSGSESMTSTNIPISATNPSVFYRLVLPQ